MPIKSYLVHPQKDRKEELAQELLAIDQCEVLPAENKDILILVTETNSKKEEKILKERLDKIHGVKLMVLVSGFETTQN